ncbi:MAG: Yip1 family protein [Alphaproteobacteria bacterium]
MNLVTRAKNMLLSPKSEWPVAAGESIDVKSLYTGYIMILSAIPPLCSLIGIGLFFHRMGLGLGGAILRYLLGLAGVYLLAIIAAKLAPNFGGRDDVRQGLKLTAYSATASWVGGIFFLVPVLGILSVLASLYSLYLLYLGVSPTMAVPPERAAIYTVAMILAAVLIFSVVALIAGAVVGSSMMGMR